MEIGNESPRPTFLEMKEGFLLDFLSFLYMNKRNPATQLSVAGFLDR